MIELNFRKMICNAGHESRPYSTSEPMPRRCAVCRMPYDRKYNHPIPCLEDGTVPGEEPEEEQNAGGYESQPSYETATSGQGSYESGSYRSGSYEASAYGSNDMNRGAYEPPAYGSNDMNRGAYESPAYGSGTMNMGMQGSRRRRQAVAEPENSLAGSQGTSENEMPYGAAANTRESEMPYGAMPGGSRRRRPGVSPVQEVAAEPVVESRIFEEAEGPSLGLYNGGDCIRIPEGGCILGREASGSEILAINPLVSRNHAYIEADRLGIVRVRDEGSLNGTYVDDGNGRRKIKAYETVELKKGDRIWLADHLLAIEER